MTVSMIKPHAPAAGTRTDERQPHGPRIAVTRPSWWPVASAAVKDAR